MCDYSKANCYGYALGLNLCLTPGASVSDIPSVDWTDGAGMDITPEYKNELIAACTRDGLAEATVHGQMQIAVFINVYAEGLDYHFYRKDGGTWSNKMGNTGKVVAGLADPEQANEALIGVPDEINGTIIKQALCCYMYVQTTKTADDFL